MSYILSVFRNFDAHPSPPEKIQILTRTIGILLKSRSLIDETLEFLADITDNPVYPEILHIISDSLMKAGTTFEVIKDQQKHVPPVASGMIKVAESTSNSRPRSSIRPAPTKSRSSPYRIASRPHSSPSPPIFIGLVAISIIMPIYQLTGTSSRT